MCIKTETDLKNGIFIKGFNNNLTCKQFQYEIGKIYELENKSDLSLCNVGFHCSPTINNVINYKYLPNSSRYCLVKPLGIIIWDHDKTKIVTDKIEIVRELLKYELFNLNNNYKYLLWIIKYKLYNNKNERITYFNKFLENCNNKYYLYSFIRYGLWVNDSEFKLIEKKISLLEKK